MLSGKLGHISTFYHILPNISSQDLPGIPVGHVLCPCWLRNGKINADLLLHEIKCFSADVREEMDQEEAELGFNDLDLQRLDKADRQAVAKELQAEAAAKSTGTASTRIPRTLREALQPV